MKINIPKEVADSPHRDNIFAEHFIQAWLYTHSADFSFDTTNYKSQWLKQITLNQIQDNVAKDVFTHWPMNLSQPLFIKGYALEKLGLYDTGERFKSDIDILIDQESLNYLENKIQQLGGTPILEKKWWGNSHKKMYSIIRDDQEVVIECHTQLFYHLPLLDWQKYRHPSDVNQLTLEAHLLFLMGHYVFQHNCLKLYWLLDITLFIEKFSSQLDWQKLSQMAKDWKLERSFYWSLSLASILSNETLQIPRMYLNSDKAPIQFAWQTKQSGFQYWKMKHFAKGNLWNALIYDLKWILNKTRK